ncbi:hypothetical protein ACFLQ2_00775 [archaeon]
MVVAIAYATLALEDSIKRESQKQTLVNVGEYVGRNVVTIMQYLDPGQSGNQTFRIPLSKDYYAGQYTVKLEDIDDVVYITVTSLKWSDMSARQPLYLNASKVDINTAPAFPPAVCATASRNTTHYQLSLNC